MNRDIDTALDDCLAMLRAGASVDECLAVYPAHAAALRSPLELTVAVQDLPMPQARRAAVQANRERMMAAVARRQANVKKTAPLPVSKSLLSRYTERISVLFKGKEDKDAGLVIRFATAALVAVLVFTTVSAGTAAVASSSSLPGDALYPVKRAIEDVQLSLMVDESAREQFRAELEARRRDEVQAVIRERREVQVRFWGPLTAFDASRWVVGGVTILVDSETRITGEPFEGVVVHVLAVTQADGSILARQLVVMGAPAHQGPQATPGPQRTPHPSWTPPPTPTEWPTPPPTPKRSTPPATPTGWPTPPPMPTEWPTPPPMPTEWPTPPPMPTEWPTMPPMPTEWPTMPPRPTRWPTPPHPRR